MPRHHGAKLKGSSKALPFLEICPKGEKTGEKDKGVSEIQIWSPHKGRKTLMRVGETSNKSIDGDNKKALER